MHLVKCSDQHHVWLLYIKCKVDHVSGSQEVHLISLSFISAMATTAPQPQPQPMPMILRVVEPDRSRKLKLNARPASVDALIQIIKQQLQLDLEFTLEYEDPDFDGSRTQLVHIDELPQKAVVHIVSNGSSSSSSTASTDILSDVSSPERVERWPTGIFPIPKFSFDVELVLQKGNEEYERSGTLLNLRRDQKHDILETLAKTMFSFKAYESKGQREQVAKALVTKHPCLKDAGSDNGWDAWTVSLQFKLGNYRNKLRNAGCLEVAVNAGRRSRNNPDPELQSPHAGIKRPRRAEVNYLPNFPQGQDAASLELLKNNLVDEVQKTERNLPLISKMMQTTFALRRQSIVVTHPPVIMIMNTWPALKIESEVGFLFIFIFFIYISLHTFTNC